MKHNPFNKSVDGKLRFWRPFKDKIVLDSGVVARPYGLEQHPSGEWIHKEDLRALLKEKYPIHETSTYHKGRKDIIKELLAELSRVNTPSLKGGNEAENRMGTGEPSKGVVKSTQRFEEKTKKSAKVIGEGK